MRHKQVAQRTHFWGAFLMTAVFVDNVKVVAGDRQWSSWLNSDSPAYGQGDDETVERIYVTLGLPCRPEDVSAVQCRRAGTDMDSPTDPFQYQTRHQGNVLHVPCNTSGLLCRHLDQMPAQGPSHLHTWCADYEIRVLCYDRGSHDSHGNASKEITSHGAFIASVAGGSVVLPLVFVLILRLRKSKREQQQGQQRAQGAGDNPTRTQDEEEAQATDVDAPPSYDALFASSEPVSTISDGSVAIGETIGDERRSSTDRLITSDGYVGHGIINHGLGSIGALSSGVSSAASSTRVGASSSQGVLSSSGLLTVTTPTRLATASSVAGLRRISSASSASSASSTHPLLTHGVSESDVTHTDPPPAYDWSGRNHVTVVMPADRSEVSSEETSSHSFANPSSSVDSNDQSTSTSGEPQRRRFLGMHLSIFDLMAVIYPDPAATPPPTYDDALKILGVPQQPDVQVS